jgi:outer membrane protein assembly factor BamB
VAVHDLVVAGRLIVAGTEEGEIHAIDERGRLLWSQSVGASVNRLSTIAVGKRPAIVAGLADGRLLALPAQ